MYVLKLPKINFRCPNCRALRKCDTVYRRYSIPNSKNCKWIRFKGVFYCPSCNKLIISTFTDLAHKERLKQAIIVP